MCSGRISWQRKHVMEVILLADKKWRKMAHRKMPGQDIAPKDTPQ
jgi:hypothetical protein